MGNTRNGYKKDRSSIEFKPWDTNCDDQLHGFPLCCQKMAAEIISSDQKKPQPLLYATPNIK